MRRRPDFKNLRWMFIAALGAGLFVSLLGVVRVTQGRSSIKETDHDDYSVHSLQATVADFVYPRPGLVDADLPSPECQLGSQPLYVDDVPTNGDGSLDSPFNDIQDAIDVVKPGNTIYILPGTYNLNQRLITQRDASDMERICLQAYDPTNRPVIQRADGSGESLLTVRHPYYVVDGIIFDGRMTPESNSSLVNISHYSSATSTDNGDFAILRNCVVRNNRRNGISVSADHVLIENCEIYNHLRGSMSDPVDAHGILATHETDLTVRYCDIHHVSGDSLQTDPDLDNIAGTKLWDQVLIEHTRMWTGPLAADAGEWQAGDNPGENAVDTKTFENVTLPYRPQMTVHNVEAFGFTNTSNPRRSAFNIKYQVDWLIDGALVYDNEIAFRVRGPYDNPAVGGAHATIQNIVVYNNDMVYRIERDIEQLHLYHHTADGNDIFAYHADCPVDPCYDEANFEFYNSLFLGEKPADAAHSSNLVGDDSDVRDAANHDYHLMGDSSAVNRGLSLEDVSADLDGVTRPQNGGWDVGAYEFLPQLILNGWTGNGEIYLIWDVNADLTVTATWTINYDGPIGDQPPPIEDIPEITRAYMLTGLTNYEWYTVTLTTDPTMLTDTLRIMPTDHLVNLPLVMRDE